MHAVPAHQEGDGVVSVVGEAGGTMMPWWGVLLVIAAIVFYEIVSEDWWE